MQRIKKYIKSLDKSLFAAVTICAAISIILLYSLSGAGVIDSRYYQVQALSAAAGMIIALVISAVNYGKIAKLWFLYFPFSIAITLLTFTSLGVGVSGADDVAWLNIGITTIQPSEILKLAFLMSFSYHLSKVKDNLNSLLNVLLLCLHGALPTLIVAAQGDHGTALIFLMMFMAMLFGAGISIKYIMAALLAAPVLIYFGWNNILNSSQKERILILFNQGSDELGVEWQQDLGLSTLSQGGLFGKGLSNTDIPAVPEIYNDFIFTYLGYCFGFVGTIAALFLIMYICIKIIADSRLSKDELGKNICIGTFAIIFSHCVMNIGMVLKVMPVIGVPLPFLSAGGTAMISMYAAIGLVMSTYSHKEVKRKMFYTAV